MDAWMTSTRVPGARRRLLLALLAALAIGLTACGPEASRAPGTGRSSGADVGNRDKEVEMHGAEEGEDERDDRMYYDTPIDTAVTQ